MEASSLNMPLRYGPNLKKKKKQALAGMAQMLGAGASSHRSKGLGFDFRPGHIPRLQV